MRRATFVALSLALALTLSACSKPISRDEGDILEVKKFNTVMQTEKDLIDPVHGKQTAIWYGAMNGVGETNANGAGFVHRFEDGASTITLNLNVLEAPKDYRYVGVLTTPDGSRSVDIGEISSIIGDARHSGRVETVVDVTGMTLINVYSVKGSQKASAGTLIATGTLKEAPQK
jgi:hypothetical protein